MNITYSTEIDYFSEAGDLLTRARSVPPDTGDGHMADFPAYWKWITKRYRLPEESQEEWGRLYIAPLTEAARAGLAAAEHLPEDRAKFFFTPRLQVYLGGAHMLAVGRAFALRRKKTYSQLTAEERRLAEQAMACSVVDMEGEALPDRTVSPFTLLERGMQDDQLKWFALRLIENAESYLEELEQLMAPVMEALRQKEQLLAPLAEACMESLKAGIKSQGADYMRSLYHISPDWNEPLVALPCLFRPGDYSYYHAGSEQILQIGLITSVLLPAKNNGMSYQRLLDAMKAMGDKRRMEILTLLHQRPHYGQELAECLSLTPATISHHMNALMHAGLIALEQDGSRTRYSLSTETLEELLCALRTQFL